MLHVTRRLRMVPGFLLLAAALTVGGEGTIEIPVLDGDWWRIAADRPDVAPYRYQQKHQNVCDFTVFLDARGTWHCIACVRNTTHPGGTRLFHEWTSDDITKSNWTPRGIVKWPRNATRHKPGGEHSLQAPHCFVHDGSYYCFYNSGPARAMKSGDGIQWSVFRNTAGSEIIFEMGRDVMLFRDEARGRWLAYYCGAYGGKGAMVARTAPALAGPWSETEIPVRTDGNPESPFVLQRGSRYYLFQQMAVYASERPDRFAGDPVTHMTGIWYNGRYAPEVVVHEGQYYLAGYSRGLWVARMKWEERSPAEIDAWRKTKLAELRRLRAEARARRERREREQKKP